MGAENGIILPDGFRDHAGQPGDRVVVDNRTELPDQVVLDAVVEQASLLGLSQGSTFQTYATSSDGSLLARAKFHTPGNVYEEIKLARDLAERDDDVGAVIGAVMAAAFADGMQNSHRQERQLAIFNALAREANFDMVLKELLREYLIASQVTTFAPWVRQQIDVAVGAEDEKIRVAIPRVGVLPAECIRPLGTPLVADQELGFVPDDQRLREWLEEFFGETTSPARKAELRRQDPLAAALFTGKVAVDNDVDLVGSEMYVYRLNPRMVQRVTMPKGTWPHPRPLMTRNFALIEAKRLLNIMDFALLQGGANFIVVAKKGDKDRPAMPEEIANLEQVVRRASRTGVIIGDHRLSFDIITPQLDELLNPEKRGLLGRKLAMGMLRLPELPVGENQAGVALDVELLAKVITGDRHDLKRHVERAIYGEAVKRNDDLTSPAKLWFPKVMLQGAQWFTDYVLKLRDRGDIPRKTAVEAGGFDWEAGVAQRKRELEDDIDETMMPAAVPFSDPGAGPQDNNDGRPRGSGPDNGRPGARQGTPRDNVRPLRTVNRNAGETVRAYIENDEPVRVGERTFAILQEYPDADVGRVTPLERRALEAATPTVEGPLAVIPVNPGYDVPEVRAVRLAAGLSILLGERAGDRALVAKALCFREPEFKTLDAEETALRWGFPITGWRELEERALAPAPEPTTLPPPELHVHTSTRTKKVVRRDDGGNIIEIEDVPIEDD